MAVTDKTEEALEWNCDMEVQFFHAMRGHKPVGVNRFFQMACIHEKFSNSMNKEIRSKEIWMHLDTMYDMAALHESEILPFPNGEIDFALPDIDFGDFMAKRDKSFVPNSVNTPVKSVSNFSSSKGGKDVIPIKSVTAPTISAKSVKGDTTPSKGDGKTENAQSALKTIKSEGGGKGKSRGEITPSKPVKSENVHYTPKNKTDHPSGGLGKNFSGSSEAGGGKKVSKGDIIDPPHRKSKAENTEGSSKKNSKTDNVLDGTSSSKKSSKSENSLESSSKKHKIDIGTNGITKKSNKTEGTFADGTNKKTKSEGTTEVSNKKNKSESSSDGGNRKSKTEKNSEGTNKKKTEGTGEVLNKKVKTDGNNDSTNKKNKTEGSHEVSSKKHKTESASENGSTKHKTEGSNENKNKMDGSSDSSRKSGKIDGVNEGSTKKGSKTDDDVPPKKIHKADGESGHKKTKTDLNKSEGHKNNQLSGTSKSSKGTEEGTPKASKAQHKDESLENSSKRKRPARQQEETTKKSSHSLNSQSVKRRRT